MTDNNEKFGSDMAEYLQTFLDETEEQLDDLVETMLALERDSANTDDLNEAFRLIHSIKGSAGMMGFDNITVLTHQLENRFERFRSGLARLDEPTMNLVLRCIDFLRQCNNRLRHGEQLGSSMELLDELTRLEENATTSKIARLEPSSGGLENAGVDAENSDSTPPLGGQVVGDEFTRMVVRFRAGLQLVDLKARLIVNRLSELGDIKSTQPDLDRLLESDSLEVFEVRIETDKPFDLLLATADVDGVDSIDISARGFVSDGMKPDQKDAYEGNEIDEPEALPGEVLTTSESLVLEPEARSTDLPKVSVREENKSLAQSKLPPNSDDPAKESPRRPEVSRPSVAEKAIPKIPETMRVDIDRLDELMNLAGELVVNRARFVQVSEQVNPELRKASILNRIRDFSDSLRRTITSMEKVEGMNADWTSQIKQLRAGLELMKEQSELWDNGRYCFSQFTEAIDQLSRVSHNLHRGVLDTRMVPVGPLFQRFKRVVRDLSKERGKKVKLMIVGENTELDKRMIDELSEPLVHLVRNSIDHGLEPPNVRARRVKPEIGTIFLEASHSGNNVTIHVRDDGGGIEVEKIKAKLIENHIHTESTVAELTDGQILEYIWDPGFSTAEVVTDVSGRGVGMDVVKTRINQLSGSIDIDSTPQQGTSFRIRLPLTLAIINSLLIRIRHMVFSMPIEDVREIVSVDERAVVTVHGKQTFEMRGEFIPLVSIDDIFYWHAVDFGYGQSETIGPSDSTRLTVEIVILHVGGRTMGLRIDELLGSQDIVIKSLSDNFVNLRGLSGASILGDGSVCLMLDVGAAIDMATKSSRTLDTEDE